MTRIRVEFEYADRTYTVEPVHKWNIYVVNQLREKVSFETDLRTGEQIFVAWSEIPVIRLVSQVDGDGNLVGSPPIHNLQGQLSILRGC